MKNIRAASVQFQHSPGDKPFNLKKIRAFVEKAAARQVNLIAFPEMCITGYWHVRNLAREDVEGLAEPIPSGPSTGLLLSPSGEHGMTIGAGLIERAEDGALYNSYVVAMPDGRTACHRQAPRLRGSLAVDDTRVTTFLSNASDTGTAACKLTRGKQDCAVM